MTSSSKEPQGGGAGASGGRSPIKWDEYNYPPFVRIMHFDLSELEGSSRKVVRWAHAGFFLLVAALMCNRARGIAARARVRATKSVCLPLRDGGVSCGHTRVLHSSRWRSRRAPGSRIPDRRLSACRSLVLINFVLVCAGVPLKGLHIVYSLFSARARGRFARSAASRSSAAAAAPLRARACRASPARRRRDHFWRPRLVRRVRVLQGRRGI